MPVDSPSRQRPTTVSVNCFDCQKRDRSTWCLLSRGDVDTLNQMKHTILYQRGQIIFRQGDPCNGIYLVESGTVAVRKTDEYGNSILVRMRHQGDAVGYRDFFQDNLFSVTAEALAPSKICFVDRGAVQRLLQRNPALGLQFIRSIGQDLGTAEDAILQAAVFPVRKRLAHLLLSLKDRYAAVTDDGVMTIDLPLSRQDIASILGARRETIARAIHDLEADEVAAFSGRKVIVHDLDLLLDELEPPEEAPL
jgi:CRP/FNR family transcriptional regulator